MTKLRIRFVLFGSLLAMLTPAGPASADTMLVVPLVAGQVTSVTYTGPNDAIFNGTFSAVGETGGEPFFRPPDGEIWTWDARGPFFAEDCGRNTGGGCALNLRPRGIIEDGTLLLTMSISGSCSSGNPLSGGGSCPGFSLSPEGTFVIDVPSANPGDLFLTPASTPLPAALPLFASALGVMGLLGRRRKRKAVGIQP
jgi:hypothetical protein